jgi:hypothetical protein
MKKTSLENSYSETINTIRVSSNVDKIVLQTMIELTEESTLVLGLKVCSLLIPLDDKW